jgi:hypothetical protein
MRFIIPTLTTVAVLAVAGCGGSGSGDSAGSPAASAEDKAFDGALKFARCMRGEGLDFPDPERGSNGMIRIGPGSGPQPDPADPKHEAARKKCERHLQDGGGQAPDAAQQAKFQDAFLKYARCMRAEGVDIPDPKPGQGGGGIVFRVGDPSAPDLDSPRFKAADGKCSSALADVAEPAQETSP